MPRWWVVLAMVGACGRDDARAPSSTGALPAVATSHGLGGQAKLPGTIYFVSASTPPKLVRIRGGVRTELGDDIEPAGSLPDGRLVGVRRVVDRHELVIVDDAGAASRIGPAARIVRDPVVDPQGRWIVAAFADAGLATLQRIALPDGAATPISQGLEPARLGGDALMFVSERDGNAELYRGLVDGSDAARLTQTFAHERAPAVQPAGARIAFTSNAEGPLRIFVRAADGATTERLTSRTEGERDEHSHAWSPDGSLIAYVVQRGERRHVWIRDVAARSEHDVTPEGILDEAPASRRDGRAIVVTRTRGHDVDLWAIPTGVGDPVRVTTSRFADLPAALVLAIPQGCRSFVTSGDEVDAIPADEHL